MFVASDENLVLRIKEGDISAFEILVRRYQKKLYLFVYSITEDYGLAEEVIQDAFLNLYKTIERVDTTRKFSSYIFQIAKNTAISYLRKRKIATPLKEAIEVAGEDETVYEKLVRKDTVNLLRQKLDKLSFTCRQVITLYYFEDLSYNQIQKKLKLPLNTIKTRLRRAKLELLKLFDDENQ